MTVRVSVAEAVQEFATLVARAEAGEEVIVTRDGKPVARLGPMAATQPVPYGDLRGVHLDEDLDLPDEVLSSFEPPAPP